MATKEFLTKADLVNILEDSVSQEDINSLFSEDILLIDNLKNLCGLYSRLMNSNRESDQTAGYRLGANIIFNLRKLLIGQDITLLLGATTVDNKKLRIDKKSLTDILKDTSKYNIYKDSLNLISQLEKWEELNKSTQSKRASVWKKILDAQSLSGGNKAEFDASDKSNSLKYNGTEVYRRKKIDNNIYYSYKIESGEDEKVSAYYLKGNNFYYFNQGWLFEHFMEKWENASKESKEEIIAVSNSEHPLELFVSKNDNIPGHKGGDFRVKNFDYQAKYGNTKIISLKSIDEVMASLIKILENYQNNIRQLSYELTILFTHEKNLDVSLVEINKSYEDYINDDLSKIFARKLKTTRLKI